MYQNEMGLNGKIMMLYFSQVLRIFTCSSWKCLFLKSTVMYYYTVSCVYNAVFISYICDICWVSLACFFFM